MENHRSLCPVNLMVEIVGDKWSLLILRDIIFDKKRYFNEFRASEEKIASNILASRLAMLEQEGLISKRPDPSEHKQKVIYSLTEKSIDLLPVLVESMIWSLKYEPVDPVKYKPALDFIAAGHEAHEQFREELKRIHLGG
ncbi:winged helix-turn-helix transcriptional regulator [Mucilaginibacter aquaedulcis]|uniref:winged helix-turn-helix transcriptional regulator n=1 Tax=Mucilaginibacter aquaedulcis TaxID=1187081 RepID=UPI0025B4CB91|nr:helix-turn-helix domain-containing protein [Mucilaginibacter aquaedulcis]MDN3548889.1 helix-turn-helix domain-containing protein [Mucilaginibacter aquaedulcis]